MQHLPEDLEESHWLIFLGDGLLIAGAKIANDRCRYTLLKNGERSHDHLHLKSRIVRRTQRITQREINKQGSWRCHAFGDLSKHRDGDGGNSRFFDDALNQSDRLMAHRSNWRKQNSIHGIFDESLGHCRSTLRDEPTRRGNRSHKTKMSRRDGADGSCGC